MPTRGRTTTQRGYGAAHQAARREALKAYRPGQPCTRCGHAIWVQDPRPLHLDHTDDRHGYRGLAHPRCNTQAGARTMHTRKGHKLQQQNPKRSRNW